jgi:hypothetical protein
MRFLIKRDKNIKVLKMNSSINQVKTTVTNLTNRLGEAEA